MRKIGIFVIFLVSITAFASNSIKLTRNELADKIKGAWAGQIIACTYGGPTEFKYAIIPDNVKIEWDENSPILKNKKEFGGLYDDVYLDITFMDVFEKHGFDAPRSRFLKAYAENQFALWCANRAARFVWLDNFQTEEPTSWKVNPMYNDIDLQIEADFAGLMSPALPKIALSFIDKVGRSINSNEGFYCGAFVAVMNSIAFYTPNMVDVVKDASKILPRQSRMKSMVNDLIKWHEEDPTDWKKAWYKYEEKYVKNHDLNFGDKGIHAPINCAYIVVGLLYGENDFAKTMEISTRCGRDSDCNPANACGILGASIGYEKIPAKYKKPLEMCENKFFSCTEYTPKKVYETSFKQALQVLEKSGVKFKDENIFIKKQSIPELPYEEDCPPSSVENRDTIIPVSLTDTISLEIEGTGVILSPTKEFNKKLRKFAIGGKKIVQTAEVEIILDGKKIRTAKFFANIHLHERDFLFCARGLENKKHKLELRLTRIDKQFPEFKGFIRIFKRK